MTCAHNPHNGTVYGPWDSSCVDPCNPVVLWIILMIITVCILAAAYLGRRITRRQEKKE